LDLQSSNFDMDMIQTYEIVSTGRTEKLPTSTTLKGILIDYELPVSGNRAERVKRLREYAHGKFVQNI